MSAVEIVSRDARKTLCGVAADALRRIIAQGTGIVGVDKILSCASETNSIIDTVDAILHADGLAKA